MYRPRGSRFGHNQAIILACTLVGLMTITLVWYLEKFAPVLF